MENRRRGSGQGGGAGGGAAAAAASAAAAAAATAAYSHINTKLEGIERLIAALKVFRVYVLRNYCKDIEA